MRSHYTASHALRSAVRQVPPAAREVAFDVFASLALDLEHLALHRPCVPLLNAIAITALRIAAAIAAAKEAAAGEAS